VNDQKVFIADIQTILPDLYESHELVKRVYCSGENGLPCEFADKIVSRINIKYRPLIIDPDALPKKKLLKPEYSSLNWGVGLIDRLTNQIKKKEIGFFGLAYNVSSGTDSLPNLSSQIVIKSQIHPDVPPEEKVSYGCASGILVMERAREYCMKHNRAAIVYIFDQCSWAANIIQDRKHPDFKNCFINSLIFSDGGVGILLAPSSMRDRFDSQVLEVKDIVNAFEPADTMHFDENGIQLDSQIHEKIPRIAVDRIIQPLLYSKKIQAETIAEWSVHQGGLPILEQFTRESLLGLSREQIAPSRNLYLKYGNLSSASAFFVLHDHFKNISLRGTQGVVLSFGAGFYLGGILYEKQ
jgi:predicted naringenin-chalcone synthase